MLTYQASQHTIVADVASLTTYTGAAVLAHSLRDSSTKHKLAVLVTPDTLLPSTLSELRASQQLTPAPQTLL